MNWKFKMNEKGKSAKTGSKAVANSPRDVSRQGHSRNLRWWMIPWDVAGRIGLLFSALCLIKLVMIAGFRKHLFEIHWRMGVSPHGWLNQAAFLIFAILVALNLWRLGTRCAFGGG